MIKTMIADDEDIIREGIADFIDWNGLGLELVGQASNGVEARELIEAAAPEIIITDVKMPGMSGIELLAFAKEKQPDCVVIMISSYDQFEYAQQSLNLGSFAYLLKPIDTDKLMELLREAAGKINRNNSQRQILSTYKSVLEQAHAEVIDNKLKTLVFGGDAEGLTDGEKGYLNQFIGFEIILVHAENPIFREETFAAELEKNLEEWIRRQGAEIKRFRNRNRKTIICILYRTEEMVDYDRLRDIYGEYYERAVLGVSARADCAKKLAEAYRQSAEASEYRFFVEESVIFYEAVKQSVPPLRDMPDWGGRIRECLQRKMADADFDKKIKSITDDFLTYIYEKRPSGVIIKAAVSDILLELLHALQEQRGKPEDLFLNVSDTFASILNEKNPSDMIQRLHKVLCDGAEYIFQLEKLRPNSVVYKAKRYIEENYQNPDLRLEEVADHVFINPSYFSTIFSRECQISFGAYLTKIRMEKALHLLKTTNLKVYQIAEQVGYQNVPWFNVAFKKYTGIKPGDVRK